LTKDINIFHQEKAEIFLEGLKATPYQQIDDTGARVNGVNYYTEILCNPDYTADFTVPNKNRENILDVLLCGKEKRTALSRAQRGWNIKALISEKSKKIKGIV